jgi:hypothetical protein
MTKKTLDVSKSDNTHWPSLRRLITVKPPLSGVRYDFTLAMHDWTARRVQVNGTDLSKVNSRRDFLSERFLLEGKDPYIAFNLKIGGATLTIRR